MSGPDGGRTPAEDLVRALFDAFNRRDLDGVLSMLHDEVVFEPVSGAVMNDGEPYRGHEGMGRYFEHVQTHWRELQVQPVQIRVAGHAVVALGHVSGEGAGGPLQAAPATWFFKLRDGLVAQIQIFSDERLAKQALAAEDELASLDQMSGHGG